MKVIQKGTGQQGWSTEAKCTGQGNGGGGCGAVLMVEQRDLYKTHNYDYGGGHDTYITFRCCECKVQTDLKDVPHHVVTRETERTSVNNDPL